jgi:hypothetical protein
VVIVPTARFLLHQVAMKKLGAVLGVLLVLAMSQGIALAHTGSVSAVWDVGSPIVITSGEFQGSYHFQDPKLNDEGSELWHDCVFNAPSGSSALLGKSLDTRHRTIAANGDRGPWVAGGGWAPHTCEGEAERQHQLLVSGASAYAYEVEYHESCSGSPATCTGTFYGRAATTGEFDPPPNVDNLRVVEMGKGGQLLNYNQVAALAIRAGFSKSQSVVMTAVAKAESSFRTAAVSYIGCCGGLWQINFQVHPVSKSSTFDPYINASWAKKIFDSQGLDAWEAYTGPDGSGSDGPWLAFENDSRTAVEEEWQNGQAAYGTIGSAPAAGDGYVTLEWDEVEEASNYELERSSNGGGTWNELANPSGEQYTDSAVTNGSTYRFRVRACVVACSDWSNEVEVTIGEYDPDGDATVPGTGGAGEGDDVDPNDDDSGGGDTCKSSGKSTNCGLSIICGVKAALRWAFVPGDATCEAWQDFHAELQTRAPFSVAYGVVSIGDEVVEAVKGDFEVYELHEGTLCYTADIEVLENPDMCLGGPFVDLATEHAGIVGAMRFGSLIFLVIGTGMLVWRILRGAFAHSVDPQGGESLTDGRDDDEDDDR